MASLLAVAALATRVAIASSSSAQAVLRGRTDVASPLNSLDGIAEGAALRKLGLSPYEGSFLHTPPLLYTLLEPLVGLHGALEVLPFMAADAASALLLYRLSMTHQRRTPLKARYSSVAGQRCSPTTSALLFLCNPCSIAACCGRGWSAFETAAVLAALTAASERRPALCALALVCATSLSLYPASWAIPAALLLAQGGARMQALALWGFAWAALLAGASQLCAQRLGASWSQWVDAVYGFQLRVDDLTPNLGLWWYFFAEIFAHVRSFFGFVFHAQGAVLLIPLTVRLWPEPLVLATIAALLVALFKPFPSVADLALAAALLPLVHHQLGGARFLMPVAAALATAAVLNPVLWRLWVVDYRGNANFVLATTIVHALALIAAIVGCVSGATGTSI